MAGWSRILLAVAAVLAEAVGGQLDNLLLGATVVLGQHMCLTAAGRPLFAVLTNWVHTLMVPADLPSSLFFGTISCTLGCKWVEALCRAKTDRGLASELKLSVTSELRRTR